MTPSARSEWDGSADILGRGLAGTTGVVRDAHAAIAGRVFRMTGKAALPTRLMHDGISTGVYAAVAGGTRAVSYAAGKAATSVTRRRMEQPGFVPLRDRPLADGVVGAVNGAWGDRLLQWNNPLALPMSVRSHGRDVPLTGPGLRAAFPAASPDVVVFVHGLCETDRSWWLQAGRHYGDPASSHGSRLAAATGATPVYLRYNTGRHISENGDALGALVDDLVRHWPVPVERLTLVGHSMGGLVIRSACCQAVTADASWVQQVRRIVYLGSPHLGAPLEVAATSATIALRSLPETAPFATALRSRSVGIKDLRYGDVLASDWESLADPDAWRPEPESCTELLDGAEHFYVGVTLTRRPDHPVARVVGDALVTFESASGNGKRRRLSFEVDRGRHLGGLHHFDLLNHPRVWAVLQEWLVPEPARRVRDGKSGPDGI